MKLGIIIGSTREGRMTDRQAKWVYNLASKMDGVEAEIVDLRDYPMPFFDEPISPRYNPDRQIDPTVQPWLKKIDSLDAYVFVTPEYNHAIPGVLKNALDYVTWELVHKPAAVISHGSAGGGRAQINLKVILSESKAAPIPIPSPLAMVGMSELIDADGNLTEAAKAKPYDLNDMAMNMLTDLKWYSDALAAARASS
ncbi:MAG TPA: NAD(P)H-dependent oxidoreductase [Candidatus Saccharimonadales bacterium]|nr:NAD(P)H-dependent oxidoreductase [Candidatus Saccharimonadales bacterium]